MFEPAKNFVFTAAQKYQLVPQALGALVCEKARQIIAQDYPKFKDDWQPQKFSDGSLTIKALGSSSGELYMQTQTLLEKLGRLDLPKTVQQIKIVKG